jgi:hypothetical protein
MRIQIPDGVFAAAPYAPITRSDNMERQWGNDNDDIFGSACLTQLQ